jgi:hypothetical protein
MTASVSAALPPRWRDRAPTPRGEADMSTRSHWRFALVLAAPLALLSPPSLQAQAQVEVEVQTEDTDVDPGPRRLRDPSEALPSRSTGEAVMGGREAFDRESPQFSVGRDRVREDAAAARAAGAQLAGSDQTLDHVCEIGERVELVGDRNIVTITGECVGLSITGSGNQVGIEVVDEIRIEGEANDVRWQRGLTVDRPNMLETGGRNSVQRLAGSE